MDRHIHKWQRWFLALKAGDEVLINLPWDDKNCPGGRIVRAKVAAKSRADYKIFLYRNRYGSRLSFGCNHWCGDCYHHIIPIGYELRYSGQRGFWLKKK